MINNVKPGDILGETSHYIVESIYGDNVNLLHYESNDRCRIQMDYIKKYTKSADEVDTVIEVTKEDKNDGTPGIRSIFENIHSSEVFTVCFKKQDKIKSKRKLQEEIDTVVSKFSNDIDKVRNSRKGVADKAKLLITELIQNLILPYEEGEDRVLRGYKVQFQSRDGRYNCVDMDIERTEKESGIRPVNINQIKWIIIDGVKYVVK